MAKEIKKQITLIVPVSDWNAIRREADLLGISMGELCRRLLAADLAQLKREQARPQQRDED